MHLKGEKGMNMNMFNIICGVCSVLGLLVSLFTASKVVKISQIINCGNQDDHSVTKNSIKGSTISGGYVGRDKK